MNPYTLYNYFSYLPFSLPFLPSLFFQTFQFALLVLPFKVKSLRSIYQIPQLRVDQYVNSPTLPQQLWWCPSPACLSCCYCCYSALSRGSNPACQGVWRKAWITITGAAACSLVLGRKPSYAVSSVPAWTTHAHSHTHAQVNCKKETLSYMEM